MLEQAVDHPVLAKLPHQRVPVWSFVPVRLLDVNMSQLPQRSSVRLTLLSFVTGVPLLFPIHPRSKISLPPALPSVPSYCEYPDDPATLAIKLKNRLLVNAPIANPVVQELLRADPSK